MRWSLLLAALITSGCIFEGSSEGEGEEASAVDAQIDGDVGPDAGPDEDHRRTCEPGDWNCDAEGCNGADFELTGCYEPCTPDDPDQVGGLDDECDEPERPYCSRVGLWQGGDYDCNDDVTVCTAMPGLNRCVDR